MAGNSYFTNSFFRGPQGGAAAPQQGGLLPFSPQQQGLLGMAGALLEAGGPSPVPTSLGQGVGRGLQAMQGAQDRAQQVAMQRQYMGRQLAEQTRKDDRRQAAEERWASLRRPRPRTGAPSPMLAGLNEQQIAAMDMMEPEARSRQFADYAFAKPTAVDQPEPVKAFDTETNTPVFVSEQVAMANPSRYRPYEKPAGPATPGKPFEAVERTTGRRVFITPKQFAATPADYVPTDDAPPAPTALYRNLIEAGFKEGTPELQQAMQVALNKPQVKINMGGELSPGQKKLDEAYAVDHADFVLSGSYADATRNLNQIDDVIRRLQSGEDLTGGASTALPDMVRERLDPIGFDTQQLVEEVVQRNLKVVLGAQFTEKEGERLISRAYNPRLEEPQNIGRLNRLAGAMREGLLARKQSADYFEKHGTMKGYKGARRITINDLNDAIEDKVPETKRAGGKKIPVNFAVMSPADLLNVDAANLTGEQLDELDAAMTKAGM